MSEVSIREKYSLRPSSNSMEKMKDLLSGIHGISMDEVIELVASDESLGMRAWKIAFPHKGIEDFNPDEIGSAVGRIGVNVVVMLALGHILNTVVQNTFTTMAGLDVVPANPTNCPKLKDKYLTGCVQFRGKANGGIYVLFDNKLVKDFLTSMFGESTGDGPTFDLVFDSVGELVNIFAGNLQSNLCDVDLDCKLQTPVVGVMEVEKLRCPTGFYHEPFTFLHHGSICWVHLYVRSWK